MFIFRVGVLFIAFIHHLQPTLPLPSPPPQLHFNFPFGIIVWKEEAVKSPLNSADIAVCYHRDWKLT